MPSNPNSGLLFTLLSLALFWIGCSPSTPNLQEVEPSFDYQNIRTEIQDTVQLLAKVITVPSKYTGHSGKTTQQWHRRKWLMKNATKDELINLLDYPKGIIQVSAYEGLLREWDVNQYALLKRALRDTTAVVHRVLGCEGYPMLIGEFLVEEVIQISDSVIPLPPNKIVEIKMSEEEIKQLETAYIFLKENRMRYLKNSGIWN